MGHARTFWTAYQRALAHGPTATLIMRNEDLDPARSRDEYATGFYEDLTWLGIVWNEGPDVGGPYGPYVQSQRRKFYVSAFHQLLSQRAIYPCTCSRKDILTALSAPHATDDEPIYPGQCRCNTVEHWETAVRNAAHAIPQEQAVFCPHASTMLPRINWRFRVPDGECISFEDGFHGSCSFVAGKDFGDFVVWRNDDSPSYQLAVVVDDAAMKVTEVVRGADLLRSTARQLLLYRALQLNSPAWFHCPLMNDEYGQRLAKRHNALSLRTLRQMGKSAEELQQQFCIPW
jgi:glutamyl-tRNA synthetase